MGAAHRTMLATTHASHRDPQLSPAQQPQRPTTGLSGPTSARVRCDAGGPRPDARSGPSINAAADTLGTSGADASGNRRETPRHRTTPGKTGSRRRRATPPRP
eukprot:Lithocolla_globosa_v1_NODE_6_length_11976_cov_15.425432.p20 type:complete len:103 gc:universal NODE_6_length_11976_cov_15.425432:8746-8438(-)